MGANQHQRLTVSELRQMESTYVAMAQVNIRDCKYTIAISHLELALNFRQRADRRQEDIDWANHQKT